MVNHNWGLCEKPLASLKSWIVKYGHLQKPWHVGDTTCTLTVLFFLCRSLLANYSKPTLTVNCGSENHRFSCWATCASHGGYPGTKVTWTIPESQTRRDVNNTQIQDPHTMLVNSSSTAFFNCSNGKLTSLSCSVGGVTSEMFTVCKWLKKTVPMVSPPKSVSCIDPLVSFGKCE